MKIKLIPSGPLQVNTYLVWDEESHKGFIVDPGGFDARMTKAIEDDNIELCYVILTHEHADHIGGAEACLAAYPKAKLVFAEAAKPYMANAPLDLQGKGETAHLFPDIAVKDEDHLQVGSMDLRFLMTPGHTKGGMSIVVGKVGFGGDTLFRQSIGRTDFAGGSYKEIMESIRNKLFTLPDDTLVLPGHMEKTSIGWEKENNPFVV